MAGGNRGLRVYYNSACPVCAAAISRQRKKMRECGVSWKDIHTDDNACREIGAEREFVRERLHAVDENGVIRVGVDAFEMIWRRSPTGRWKATLVSLPILKQISTILYNRFARILYRWNRWMGHW